MHKAIPFKTYLVFNSQTSERKEQPIENIWFLKWIIFLKEENHKTNSSPIRNTDSHSEMQ